MIVYSLNNKDDIKCFGAVATSLNNTYPHAVRSKNLYNIVIKGMKNTRTPQQKTIEIPEEKIAETGVIDIALRDMKGNIRKLTDLKGKVVLLDFTVYQSAVAAPHNLMLRDLYNKYASQGLEIYQFHWMPTSIFGKHQLIICLGYACAMRMEFTQPMQLCMAYRTCRLSS